MDIQSDFPKNYRENMEWRSRILRRAKHDIEFREKVRELFFRDPLFAFNAFLFTYDPRKRPLHQQPFCTYAYQDEVILSLCKALTEGRDFGLEKSRDMGATWMVMGVFFWHWLNPTGGADFLCGSRIEDYVDKKGDMRTLLEKIRYMFRYLPGWLRPKGFKNKQHDNFMRLQNPETGASITGESNNPNFSTGGRYAGILFDEFAKWEGSDESAWTAAGDASPCRIPVSTPFGAGGQYYKVITEGKTDKVTLHWTLHPEKRIGLYCVYPAPNLRDKKALGDEWEPEVVLRSLWYDKQCERRSPMEIAQELDIDYLGAGNPVFEGKASLGLKFYRNLKIKPKAWYSFEAGEEIPEPLDSQGYLEIFQPFQKECSYVVCADIVEGKLDGDLAVVKVFNRDTKDVDATYHSQVDENELAGVIAEIARMYSDPGGDEYPWVAPETNACGLATFNKLMELEVPNLFMMPKYETTKNAVTYRKGWVTSGSSRPILISGIKDYLVDRTGFMNPRCVMECGTFVRNKNGKAEAKAGCHDDEVMCFGMCIQVDLLAPWTSKRKQVIGGRMTLDDVYQAGKDLQDTEPTPEPSIEERCLTQALMVQGMRINPREEDFEDAIDMMFGDDGEWD